jgi:hypothetical protein
MTVDFQHILAGTVRKVMGNGVSQGDGPTLEARLFTGTMDRDNFVKQK